MGPNLYRVNGRKAGTQPNFVYSTAMKASRIVWDREKLLQFITNPKATVPGTRMASPGVADPKRAKAIVDYLLTLR